MLGQPCRREWTHCELEISHREETSVRRSRALHGQSGAVSREGTAEGGGGDR